MCLLFVFSSCSNEETSILGLDSKFDDSSIEINSETAFTHHLDSENAYCFIDEGFNRWEWSMGPISSEFNWFRLYAGAGQCELDKGEHVGRVTISYNAEDNSTIVVYRITDGNDYGIDENHLYVGSNRFPVTKNGKETVALGKYPYKHSNL